MRKGFLLTGIIVVSALLCISASAEQNIEGKWESVKTVDEFGDITEDSDTIVGTKVLGSFSNTATQDGELTVEIGFLKKNDTHYTTQFHMEEYNTTPATYTSSDKLLLKTKVDDVVSEYDLLGAPPNGNLFFELKDSNLSGDILFNELYEGKDIRCIIYIGSSQYNFTIESTGFSEICDKEGFSTVSIDSMTNELMIETALKYLQEDAPHPDENEMFTENMTDLSVLTKKELSNELKGTYFTISTGFLLDNHPQWALEKYENSTVQQLGQFELVGGSARVYSNNPNAPIFNVEIQEDHIDCINPEKNVTSSYKIYKLSDNMFLKCLDYGDGDYHPYCIMIKCNKDMPDVGSSDFIDKEIEIAKAEWIDNSDNVSVNESDTAGTDTIYTDNETIKKVQEALNNSGYDCGTPDGDKGPKTTSVIQQYQTDNGLEATGEIDDALLTSLGIQ